jgi:hypothetical protein
MPSHFVHCGIDLQARLPDFMRVSKEKTGGGGFERDENN